MVLKFKRLNEEVNLPKFSTEGASNFDLEVDRIEQTAPNKAIIYFGLACEVPEDYKLVIVPRSSFTHKGWILANSPGQVDCDYRGEIMAKIEAIPYSISSGMRYADVPFNIRERAFQAHLQKVEVYKIVEVQELSETKRGTGGFGSTGK